MLLRLGDTALLASRPDQAELAFGQVLEKGWSNARAQEGMARAARAGGDWAASEMYYRDLLSVLGIQLPGVSTPSGTGTGAPMRGPVVQTPGITDSLPSVLASLRTDSIRLAGVQSDAIGLPIARAYFSAGYFTQGVQTLAAYQTPDRPAYVDQDYLALAADLDKGGEAIAKRVGEIAAMTVRELTGDALERGA